MSSSKYFERLCCLLVAAALLLSILFIGWGGTSSASRTMGYEGLFDSSMVHTIDISMDDWNSFIETCENEEYSSATITIDGEVYKNIAIRAKGNTSLSSVSSMNSDRYSFKLEFDHYDNTTTYHGLDKLVLNNLIQDNSMMKDFLVYQMMGQFGVSAPLCSYAYLTVNGQDWGLYLALEAVEDSFLQRNYGNDFGDLYKPDSMNFGGGRGNGKDFNMDDFNFEENQPPQGETMPDNSFGRPFDRQKDNAEGSQLPGGMEAPESFDFSTPPDMGNFDPGEMFGGGGKGFGGMGGSDVKLQYSDDDPSSYSSIFGSAKTNVTKADQQRLIRSLKDLSTYENLSSVLNMEEVYRYLVVHNFVVNGDSYTGSMIHNYYLYEEDGRLSMIPWDYNLAFGTFQGGSASSAVNDPIDSPLSVSEDRPMAYWVYSDEQYQESYHDFFEKFLEEFFGQEQLLTLLDQTAKLIAPYVEKDPSKFCTTEEFEAGVTALRSFLQLRAESVQGQLDGSIPSTDEGQKEDPAALVDCGDLNLSDMGSMGMGRGGDRPQDGSRPGNRREETTNSKGSGNPPALQLPTESLDQSAFAPGPQNSSFRSNNLPLLVSSILILGIGLAAAALYRKP